MSLFKRPTWAKTQSFDLDKSEENIFSHSRRSYQEIIAEEQRKKREKIERDKAKQERKERRSSAKREVTNEAEDSGSAKRRRITLEEGSGLLNEIGLSPAKIIYDIDEDDGDEAGNGDIAVRRSPRFKKGASQSESRFGIRPQSRQPMVIDIDDSPDQGNEVQVVDQPLVDEVEEDSDDDLAELARQARAQRQMKQGSASRTPDIAAKSPTPISDSARWGAPAPTPPPDATIQIFISSPIEGTKPLIVHRKLSQNLQAIREVWCSKQSFPEGITSNDVFLIYRMGKVYDVTTCRSLGVDLNAKGSITDDNNKVHLQAVTEALFHQLKAEKAWEAQKRQGLHESEDNAQLGAAEATQDTAKDESLIRLVLKAKGKPDFKLKVKPTTQIAKILAACKGKAAFDVPDGRTLFLEVDGDRLAEDLLVQDTDISDMDCIDVHIV